jgi:hypothetical protein
MRLVLFIILLEVGSCHASETSKGWSAWLSEGKALYASGNYSAAAHAFREALSIAVRSDPHPDEKDPAVRQSLIKSEIFLAYRRDLNNLALQERRLRNHKNADLTELLALQKEREEKTSEKAKIEGRMYQAIRMLAQSKQANLPFDPAQFGFEFSLPEITYCFGVVCDAESMNLPVPVSR